MHLIIRQPTVQLSHEHGIVLPMKQDGAKAHLCRMIRCIKSLQQVGF